MRKQCATALERVRKYLGTKANDNLHTLRADEQLTGFERGVTRLSVVYLLRVMTLKISHRLTDHYSPSTSHGNFEPHALLVEYLDFP